MKRTFQIRNDAAQPDERKAEPTGSVLNALAILECFDTQHPQQSLAEISRRLGVPKATALRNLAALERFGYVVRDIRNGYSLGAQVLALSQRFLNQYEIVTVARPILGQLAEETGETAHVGVLQGSHTVYIDIAESPQRVRAYVLRGDHIPAHCTASGKAILANSSDAAVEAFLRDKLIRLTSETLTEPAAFLRELAATRKQGYGVNRSEWMADVMAVSAPVFSHTGQAVGAVGIAGPISRLGQRKLEPLGRLIRSHADRVSSILGAPGIGRSLKVVS